MRYAQIRDRDISNGPGIGVALFTQGCPGPGSAHPLRCQGCHNASIWNFEGGKEYTIDTQHKILELIKPDYITRFSTLGGEPTANGNIAFLYSLYKYMKDIKPDIKIWLWSGYTFEELNEIFSETQALKDIWDRMLPLVDVLVDGPFILSQKDITLKWRGSSNQRVIDIPATLKENKIVLLSEDN